MNRIEFKPLATSDIEILLTMMSDFYAIDHYPIDLVVSRNLIETFINHTALGKGWLILFENKVIGYCILTFVFSFEYQGRIAFLDELYLSKEARGKGIGKAAIAFIKSESHKLSLKLIYLEVENHNENAQKLYLAHDFAIHNRKIMKYKIPNL